MQTKVVDNYLIFMASSFQHFYDLSMISVDQMICIYKGHDVNITFFDEDSIKIKDGIMYLTSKCRDYDHITSFPYTELMYS